MTAHHNILTCGWIDFHRHLVIARANEQTKGRIKALNRHLPQVVIDIHEMGGDSSYYFAPAAEPFNPLMTAEQINNMNLIGENHALGHRTPLFF